MKDLFYFMLIIAVGAIIVWIGYHDPVYQFPNDTKGIVIDKHESYVLGDIATIAIGTDTIETKPFVCYDILYDQISVGDTIWNGKIHKVKK